MQSSTDLHGLSQKTTLTDAAKHEAGHSLMLWLLDCHLLGVFANEKGGLTISSNSGSSLQIPSLPLLHILAGMAMGRDNEVIDDLCQHIDAPDYFQQDTDARKVATMIRAFDGSHISALHHHLFVLSRFRNRFRRPYRELLSLLLQPPHTIGVVQAYGFFNRWDVEFGFDHRPKSDFVIRMLLREFNQKPPRCRWLSWDMKPLEEWTYKQPPLEASQRKRLYSWAGCLKNRSGWIPYSSRPVILTTPSAERATTIWLTCCFQIMFTGQKR